jgi:D-amino-acid oxidase
VTTAAVVVGSGVTGLTTAVVLAESGWDVTVVAERAWPDTTSRVAGAIWLPYLSSGRNVSRWATTTYDVLADLAEQGAPGVRLGELIEGGPVAAGIPAWAQIAEGLRPLRAEELPAGWVDGFRCLVPLVDMGRYLPYLAERLAAAGGKLQLRRIERLVDLAPADVVVNCSGLGAIDLAGDTSMHPVRGQVVITANPGLTGAVVVDGEASGTATTYRVAHLDEVVLGGTAERDAWALDVDDDAATSILERARALEPRLLDAEVVGHRVGLRPWRPAVRVEADSEPPDGVISLVHNYGHGGSGLTLSWGCARHAARLAGI